MILVAQVDEGIGDKHFTALVRRTKDVAAWSRKLRSSSRFELGQWQWQRMGWTRQRGKVFLVSQLSGADARAAFTEPFRDLRTALAEAIRRTGAKRVVVVPEGPYVVTQSVRR